MRKNPIQPAFPKFRRRSGFTLIELLIVIAIIAVLATLIFGISRRMSDKAQRVNAISALRQVGTANVAYTTENFGNINTMRYGGDPKEGGGGKWVTNSFWGRCSPYLFSGVQATNDNQLKTELDGRLDQFFSSTNANKMTKTIMAGTPVYHDSSGLPVPFSFNAKMFPWGRFMKASSFSDSGRVLWATYGFGAFNETHGQTYVPLPPAGSPPSARIYYFANKKAIGAFLDGHVEELSPPISKQRFE